MRTGVFAAFSAGKIFSGFPGFSAPTDRGARTAAGGFALTGRLFFCTDCAGHSNCVSGFAPNGRLLPAPESRGTRTAAGVFALSGRLLFCTGKPGRANCRRRVRPFRAESFSLNLSREDSPSADGGNVPRPAAGAKRKDNLRFSFLFELLPFPCFLIWRRLPTCDRSEMGERQSGYRSVSFSAFSQFTDSVLLHIRATLRRRDITVSRKSLAHCNARHLRG